MNSNDFSKEFQRFQQRLADAKLTPKAHIDWMTPDNPNFVAAVRELKKLVSGSQTVLAVATSTIARGVEVLAIVIGFDVMRDGKIFWIPVRRDRRIRKDKN